MMHFMNPQRGRHMSGEQGEHHGAEHHGGGSHPHSIHIHHAGRGEPHPDNSHHVHIHHADGSHEHTDHNNFDEAMDHANSMGANGGEQLEEEEGEGNLGAI